MQRIHVLPVTLRNKIAAGEVIERPASVVKELVENSIDAGATRIEVVIAGAGRKLIKVSDNGSGMGREDALLAFERYATSKIRTDDDLFHITSMGFRGEALSSIAAVAKVRLTTALRGRTGTCSEISGGEALQVRECAAAGTTIEVKDLFFNTPARRKFLKTDATERHHIVDTVLRIALANPGIGFTLAADGDTVFAHPSAASLRERLAQVFGMQFVEDLLPCSVDHGSIRMDAFVGKPGTARSTRGSQFLFVNRRPVKDQSIQHAVYKAYESLIPGDRHPVYFILLEIEPESVDVNVHPTKREVRFEDSSALHHLVFRTLHEALREAAQEFRPSSTEGKTEAGHYRVGAFTPQPSGPGVQSSTVAAAVSEALPGYDLSVPFLHIGDTVVAVASSEGLTLIDYHAAHERVNYERFLSKAGPDPSPLLFPRQVELGSHEKKMVLQHRDILKDFGVEVEDFGANAVLVRSLPSALRDEDPAGLLRDAVDGLIRPGDMPGGSRGLDAAERLRMNVAARLACHASVRGRRDLPDALKLGALLRQLDDCREPDRCPHGRPTRITISASELKKMFRK